MPIWLRARGYVYNHSVSEDSDKLVKDTQECKTIAVNLDLEKIDAYCRTTRSFQYQNVFEDVGGVTITIGPSEFLIDTRYEDFCLIMDKYIGKPIEESYVK